MSKLNPGGYVREELMKLYKKHRRLTTRIVVATAKEQFKAKGPKHGLAKYFTWDKEKGWEKNLLEEAGYLIRRVNLQEAEFPDAVRAWVSLRQTPVSTNEDEPERAENVYVPLPDVLASKSMRENLIARALDEATAWVDRYNKLSELARITTAVNYVKMRVVKDKI